MGIERYKIPAALSALLVITFLSLYPCLCNGFTLWDDNRFVAENRVIRELSFRNIRTMFSSAVCENYAPLAFLSYAVEYRFAGTEDPFVFHAVNLSLHLLNCLLVFWLIYLLSGNAAVSFVTALLFGVHPMHVESVAWISERRDVLYSFFFLLSLVFYVRYLKGVSRAASYAVSLGMFVLSMLSKTMAVTLPALLFLVDYLLRRKAGGKALLDKAPFAAAACALGAAGYLAQQTAGNLCHLDYGPLNGAAFAVYNIAFYLKKLVLPAGLSAFYPYPGDVASAVKGIWSFSLPLLAVVSAAVVFSARYTKKAVFGFLFFLIAILPVIKFIPLGRAIAADRYVYIAYIGLFYIAAEGLCRLYRVKNTPLKAAVIISAAAAVCALSLLASQRCRIWKDDISLWNDAIARYPSLEAYIGRGLAHANAGRIVMAMEDYNRAIAIGPYYSDVYTNRGNLYLMTGEFEKALQDYSAAIELSPASYKPYYNRGLTYIKLGDFEKAIADFTKAIELNPGCPEAFCNRGACFGNTGRPAQALRDFDAAIGIDPQYTEANLNKRKVLELNKPAPRP